MKTRELKARRWRATAATSERMRRVRQQGTAPELIVRRTLSALGYRYRHQFRTLPGRPDIVFTSLRKVIFIHGCFWHRHGKRCPRTTMPSRNVALWTAKFDRTKIRDHQNLCTLRELGWDVLVVWECQVRKENLPRLGPILIRFLEDG